MRIKLGILLAVFMVIFLFTCSIANAQTLYVNCNAAGGDGSSWSAALKTLQAALSTAQYGDEIWVAAGIYKPTSDNDRTKYFEMKNGVSIYGGFAGTESSRSERNLITNRTVLSGDIGREGDNTDNSYHVVCNRSIEFQPLNSTAMLDGFTITGGNASDGVNFRGGGIYNENSNPTLNNNIFTGNSAIDGGGMGNYNSKPTLTNVTFSNNCSSHYGGGMYNEHNSSPFSENVTFNNNVANIYGGGICNEYSSPVLTNATFSGNIAMFGGGLDNSYSNPVLTNTIFNSNIATNQGGGMWNYYSNPTLTNITFSNNNSLEGGGGGMCNCHNSKPTLTNVTFNNNSAANNGGGMYNYNFINENSSPVLTNCIMWGNHAPLGAEIFNDISTPSVTYCNIQGGYPGDGNIDADPLFAGSGNLRLKADSPCINSGSNVPFGDGGIASNITTDIDGNPRIIGDTIDMGAYEAAPTALTLYHIYGEIALNGANKVDTIVNISGNDISLSGTYGSTTDTVYGKVYVGDGNLNRINYYFDVPTGTYKITVTNGNSKCEIAVTTNSTNEGDLGYGRYYMQEMPNLFQTKANEATNKELLEKVAHAEGIPIEILTGIAETESACRQFYDWTNVPIIQPYWRQDDAANASEYLSTIRQIYGEGWWQKVATRGLGIMQVTPGVSYKVYNEQMINQLLYDIEYNVTAAAKLLYNEKWSNNKIPKINSHDPRYLEDWYFAVQAYNGWYGTNNTSYADKVFAKLGLSCPLNSVSQSVYSSVYHTESQGYITYNNDDLCSIREQQNFRCDHSANASIIGTLYKGDLLRIIDSNVFVSDGFLWQKAKCISTTNQSSMNKDGYIAIKYLSEVPQLTNISLSLNNYNPKVGDKQNSVVIAIYSDNSNFDVTKYALYESSDTSVAKVSIDGVVAAEGVGGSVITATYGGKSDSANVAVTDGCFIATAAYGSYLDPHVWVLRNFRDNILLKSNLGRWCVEQYYKKSPPLAAMIAGNNMLRFITRIFLTPLVFVVEYPISLILVVFGILAWQLTCRPKSTI